MSEELADSLAKRYLNRLETSKSVSIVSLMDFFNSSKSQDAADALTAILRANLATDVYLNYQTWGDYQQRLVDKRIQSALQQTSGLKLGFGSVRHQPVRPNLPQRGFMTTTQKRGFSSTQSKEAKDSIKYSEEYLQKQEEQ